MLVLGAMVGCSSPAEQPGPAPTSASPSASPASTDVISFDGTHGVAFGSSRADLLAAGRLQPGPGGCQTPMLRGVPYASPVFDHDQLVLIWAYPPLHTPEGVAVGTPLDRVRALYPGAEILTPPTGTEQYPALLVTSGDRSYLLLHDQREVQKLVVGFTSAARELFRTGFGSC